VRDALSKALAESIDPKVERILAGSFFRTRPMQAGTQAEVVVRLSERRDGFLAAGPHGGMRR
jgi:hypothetical protein